MSKSYQLVIELLGNSSALESPAGRRFCLFSPSPCDCPSGPTTRSELADTWRGTISGVQRSKALPQATGRATPLRSTATWDAGISSIWRLDKFAVAYADLTEQDHAALVHAQRTGRIVADAEAD